MIGQKLKDDLQKSMRVKDKLKTTLLRTILGEMDRIGKNLSNKQIDKIIRQMHTNAIELNNDYEEEILNSYLLPTMTDEEIDIAVRHIVTMNVLKGINDLENVITLFDNKYKNNSYDKKVLLSTTRKWLLK